MKNLSLKNVYDWPITMRLLIIGLLCAVVFYLCYLWDISSLSNALADDQQKEQDIKQQLQLTIDKQSVLTSNLSQSQQLVMLLNQWQSKLIQYGDLPKLLDDILKLGSDNQLQFALFHPDIATKENIYNKVPIKIIAVGNYRQIANFVSQVANLSKIVVISDFIISNENKSDVLGPKLADEANAQNLLTAELTFEVYYLAEKNTQK